MQSSIDRYLHEPNYEHSIVNSRPFKESRDVLEGKGCFLREKKLGKNTQKNSFTSKRKTYCGNAVSLVTNHLRTLYLLSGANSRNVLGYEVHSFSRRNNKNKTKWLTPKKLATVTKNAWNTIWKVPCKTLSKAGHSWGGKVRIVLFTTNCKSLNKHLF